MCAAEQGKLLEIYSFRIPYSTKKLLDGLSVKDRSDLNERLRLEVARKLHETKFDPKDYLGE